MTAKPETKLPPTTYPTSALRGIRRTTLLDLYRAMLRIRRAQEALMREYHPADEMRCPVHFCVGQEAPPAAVCLQLRKEDYTFTGHRSHGYYLAKGGSLQGLFAELYGKATGSNGGKAGSQEICDEEVNFYSGTILVGSLAIGAGTALSSQIRGEDRVTVVVLGDGGADEGLVYETLNFAALKRLPMVFICENNLYSTYSRQNARQATSNLAGRARAFGVPGRRLDGNDVVAVWLAARRAISRARRGLGPTFLELETYRWCGHVGPEDDDHLLYRTPEELAGWKEYCPIEALRGSLTAAGVVDGAQLEHLEQEVSGEIQDAFHFAKASPFPKPDALLKDVFADGPSAVHLPLEEMTELAFDFRQAEAVPRPY